MKTLLLYLGFMATTGALAAQPMQVKKHNYEGFTDKTYYAPALLHKRTGKAASVHPEFGYKPFNAQCGDCIELIDRRTIDSRFYIDPNNPEHTYSQKSIFPLHYNVGGNWVTIDGRLKPDAHIPGIYTAPNQPSPTQCNMNKPSVSIFADGLQFEYSGNMRLYFTNGVTATNPASPGYVNYTVGEDGLLVKNIWPGINMEQTFATGQIKTGYTINAPLPIPQGTNYMVIQDRFTLPNGYSFKPVAGGVYTDGYYYGSYEVTNAGGDVLIVYKQPVYYDATATGMHGGYRLEQSGNNYVLEMMVPVSWLTRPENVYPITIDPLVYSTAKMGNFSQSNMPGAAMGFTTMNLGSCDYQMNVSVPGNSQLVDVLLDLEYELTYDANCGNPPLQAPFCTFNQVSMELVCDSCQTATGPLSCNPAAPPYTGTCSTDGNLVPNATAIRVSQLNPNFLSCYSSQLQCGSWVSFTLRNQNTVCGDVCGYLCATGNMWLVTLEADGSAAQPTITIMGDTLLSSSATGNQWYLNDSLLPGATQTTYVVTHPGEYSLRVADSLGCLSAPAYANLNCRAVFNIVGAGFMGNPGTYYGYNQSIGNNLTYLWDFGDGNTSSVPYPNHQYAQPGIYNVCLTVSNTVCTNTYCDSSFYVFKNESGLMSQLVIQAPVAVERVEKPAGFNVYPNPAGNRIFIETENLHPLEVRLVSADGRVAVKQPYSNMVEIDALPAGIYFVEVKYQWGVLVKRLVKM